MASSVPVMVQLARTGNLLWASRGRELNVLAFFSPLVTACSVTNPRYIYLQSPNEILYPDKTILSRM